MDGFGSIATFAENAVKSAWDRIDFKNSPFQTILGNVLPIAAFYAHPALGLIFLVGEMFGYGPGFLGKQVDKLLGLKSGGVKPAIDIGSVKSVASTIVNKLSSLVGLGKTSSLGFNKRTLGELENLCIMSSHNSSGFVKMAIVQKTMLQGLWRGIVGLGKNGGKQSLIGALVSFIMTCLKGIGAFALVGGVAKTISGKKSKMDIPLSIPAGWLYYKNIKKNVQDTMIHYLNGEVKSFSNLYYKENGSQLYGSSIMKQLLSTIEKSNKVSIPELDNKKGFVAPDIMEIAKMVLPGFRFVDAKI